MSTRPVPISSFLAEILKTHYVYEIDMLQKTYVYLADGKFALDTVAENALIELFVSMLVNSSSSSQRKALLIGFAPTVMPRQIMIGFGRTRSR